MFYFPSDTRKGTFDTLHLGCNIQNPNYKITFGLDMFIKLARKVFSIKSIVQIFVKLASFLELFGTFSSSKFIKAVPSLLVKIVGKVTLLI